MQYGVCGGPGCARAAAEAGFDFFEWSVQDFLKPQESDEAFAEALAGVEAAELPCRATNCFVPGDLKITGPDVSMSALEKYVTTAFRRAEKAGVKTVVFGSGGARQIPDGFDEEAARRQIVGFCRMLAPVAQGHGVTVVVEPLSRNECNVLTTVRESAELVREVDHPALRLLVDAYHWAKDNDSPEDIAAYGELVSHLHIATVPNRLAPGAEECDFGPFFDALRQGGYDGSISIEARIDGSREELSRALTVMKSHERS